MGNRQTTKNHYFFQKLWKKPELLMVLTSKFDKNSLRYITLNLQCIFRTVLVWHFKDGFSKTRTCGEEVYFLLKKGFKIVQTVSNVCLQILLNADVFAYFSFPRSYNFSSNFNLKLKNFIFLTFSIFWKSPYFAQNQLLLYVWVFVQIDARKVIE